MRPFACKRIRNYAASSASLGGSSPDRSLEEASRIEEEEINRSVSKDVSRNLNPSVLAVVLKNFNDGH